MRVQVFVRLKPGVLDVQGKAVERGIAEIGVVGMTDIRIGKLIELDVEAASTHDARMKVEDLCQKLLANTIIETYEIAFPTKG